MKLAYFPLLKPQVDFSDFVNELYESKNWFKQPTRGSSFHPLYYFKPNLGFNVFSRLSNNHPKILDWLKENFLNELNPHPEIHILKSEPGTQLPLHVDTTRLEKIRNKSSWKIRVVIDGDPNTLFFMNKKKKIHIPNEFNTYIIDGSCLHGMDNPIKNKLVVAMGWPWKNKDEWVENQIKTQSEELGQYNIYVEDSITNKEHYNTMDFKND